MYWLAASYTLKEYFLELGVQVNSHNAIRKLVYMVQNDLRKHRKNVEKRARTQAERKSVTNIDKIWNHIRDGWKDAET